MAATNRTHHSQASSLRPASITSNNTPGTTSTDKNRCLLIRRNPASGELAFYLCWSPGQVALSALVRVAGISWCTQECFQAAKGQVGLDHYQIRHWTSWHRHLTLAMLALALLAAVAVSAKPVRALD